MSFVLEELAAESNLPSFRRTFVGTEICMVAFDTGVAWQIAVTFHLSRGLLFRMLRGEQGGFPGTFR